MCFLYNQYNERVAIQWFCNDNKDRISQSIIVKIRYLVNMYNFDSKAVVKQNEGCDFTLKSVLVPLRITNYDLVVTSHYKPSSNTIYTITINVCGIFRLCYWMLIMTSDD